MRNVINGNKIVKLRVIIFDKILVVNEFKIYSKPFNIAFILSLFIQVIKSESGKCLH